MGSLNSENIFANADGTKPSINLILKSDSNGTLEALSGSVLNMKVDEVNLKLYSMEWALLPKMMST